MHLNGLLEVWHKLCLTKYVSHSENEIIQIESNLISLWKSAASMYERDPLLPGLWINQFINRSIYLFISVNRILYPHQISIIHIRSRVVYELLAPLSLVSLYTVCDKEPNQWSIVHRADDVKVFHNKNLIILSMLFIIINIIILLAIYHF